MVELTAREAVLFVVLLTCVPLQLWLTQSVPRGERDRRAVALLRDLAKTVQKVTSLHYWESVITTWTNQRNYKETADPDLGTYARLSRAQLAAGSADGECPAVEVLRHYNSKGYYGLSANQRRYRTAHVQYRVGQVVQLTQSGSKAIVVGWDETCQAPDSVMESMYEQPEEAALKETPHYTLLGERGKGGVTLLYAAQRDLSLLQDTPVRTEHSEMFFTGFDGTRYLLRPWLAAVYPED